MGPPAALSDACPCRRCRRRFSWGEVLELRVVRGALTTLSWVLPWAVVQQPAKEMNSPRGDGRVGVNGWKAKVCEVLKPAFLAVLKSTKGSSALTACSIDVQQRVRS